MNAIVRKTTVVISLLCYLTAASVASAHAFPMANSQAQLLMVVADPQEPEIDCHSQNTSAGEQTESVACKIFCSAMAQAMTGTVESISFVITPGTSIVLAESAVLSRQLSVEPHPPK